MQLQLQLLLQVASQGLHEATTRLKVTETQIRKQPAHASVPSGWAKGRSLSRLVALSLSLSCVKRVVVPLSS